ncbi:MAG TPA: uroporphyrinogen decarboxylase (URO-D) [Bacteroidales bacterium]|nr:uroporphyrinogen decarboxylase (URO-D) [Bacteroidales bacterium]
MGFPGINMTNCTIKLAQQNYGEQFKILKAIAETFEPDILFPMMDLSVEVNALGRYTIFPKSDSATVVKDRFTDDDFKLEKNVNISFDMRLLGYVETVKMMSVGLPDSILKGAYVTGPFSLASLILGADDAVMATIAQPSHLHKLCQLTTEKIQSYVRLLIAAGAQVICILEPTSVMLGPDQFKEFSSDYVSHIVKSCRYTGVATVYHTCGNTTHLVDNMVESGVDVISLDSPRAGVDLPEIAGKLKSDIAIMGNIDPTGAILKGQPEEVETEVNNLLKEMESFHNFILSTGCDLPQETPLPNIEALMNTGRRYRLPANI